jgi:sirohydrochlorin ferrochelatase
MDRFALIAAHGQPSDPGPAEGDLHRLGQQVAARLPGWHIATATLAGPDALSRAIDGRPAPLVLPFFMAEGWFTRSELPRRLTAAGIAAPRLLPAFGTWPEVAALAGRAAADEAARAGWPRAETTLLLAAHGSGRSRAPSEAARAIAGQVQGFAAVRLGFIEEAPFLPARSLCLPLFVARWGHVTDDIPAALAEAGFTGRTLDPVGCHPEVPALIAARIAAG